jgi:hypothetical protein
MTTATDRTSHGTTPDLHGPARLALLLPWGRWEHHPYRPTAEHLSHVQAEASFVRHVVGL